MLETSILKFDTRYKIFWKILCYLHFLKNFDILLIGKLFEFIEFSLEKILEFPIEIWLVCIKWSGKYSNIFQGILILFGNPVYMTIIQLNLHWIYTSKFAEYCNHLQIVTYCYICATIYNSINPHISTHLPSPWQHFYVLKDNFVIHTQTLN